MYVYVKFGTNTPFCNSIFGKFFSLKNPITFIPFWRVVSPKVLIFEARREYVGNAFSLFPYLYGKANFKKMLSPLVTFYLISFYIYKYKCV